MFQNCVSAGKGMYLWDISYISRPWFTRAPTRSIENSFQLIHKPFLIDKSLCDAFANVKLKTH